jgi:hypothetical protein
MCIQSVGAGENKHPFVLGQSSRLVERDEGAMKPVTEFHEINVK